MMAGSTEVTAHERGATASGSVRRRFIILVFAVALPALIGAAVLISDAYRFTRAQAERQLLETTRALSLVVDNRLGQAEATLRALAASEAVRTGDWDAVDRQARQALDPDEGWVVLYDLQRRQLVNTRVPRTSQLPAAPPGRLGEGFADIRAGRTHICNLTDGPVVRRPTLCVARPVTANGRLYGLVVAFEPTQLDTILAEQKLPRGWYGVILDRAGRVLARTIDSDQFRGRKVTSDFAPRLKGPPESIGESVALDGVLVISSLSRSAYSGWSFVVAIPRSELTGAVQRSMALGSAAALLLVSLGIIAAVFAARGLTRPIQALALDAERLGKGETIEERRTGVRELDAVSSALVRAASDLNTVQLRLNLAKQAAQIGVWERRGEGYESWWSNSFYEVTGLDPSTPPDQRIFTSMIAEDDREAAVNTIRAAREGESFDITFRFRRPEGEWRWLTSRGRCIRDNPKHIIGICLDVTEMRRLAEKLEAANHLLEGRVAETTAERDRTWKLSRDMFAVSDMEGRLLAVNPAWTSLLGWTEDELVGQQSLDFVHPDDARSSKRLLSQLHGGQIIERFEHRLRHRDGRWRWIAWTAVPENGQIHAVGRDVTDERAAAEELAGAQAALHEAQKIETLGQLTGGVAHDFNNLLTPIVGTLDLLRRRFLDDKRATQLLDAAIGSADRARILVDRLLTFARRQSLKPRSVDIGELVGGMADLIQRSLGPTVPVTVDIPVDLPPARVDPNQLELALLNLAVNARDAMPEGGRLSIVARADETPPVELPPERYVRLSVTDEGAGMDPETLRRAVEPFFSTKGIGKGTGLGLSMAHGLAAQSGGALTLDSRQGVGTTVSIWLPVGTDDVEAQASTAPLMRRHCGTILLVDDEPSVRSISAAMLDEIGCTVIEAGSGAVALAVLRDGAKIDAIITDQLMPGMLGSALIAEARKIRPGIPAMIVSGYADAVTDLPDDVQRLPKPFLSPELSEKLEAILSTPVSS